jgi:hypothetical protein
VVGKTANRSRPRSLASPRTDGSRAIAAWLRAAWVGALYFPFYDVQKGPNVSGPSASRPPIDLTRHLVFSVDIDKGLAHHIPPATRSTGPLSRVLSSKFQGRYERTTRQSLQCITSVDQVKSPTEQINRQRKRGHQQPTSQGTRLGASQQPRFAPGWVSLLGVFEEPDNPDLNSGPAPRCSLPQAGTSLVRMSSGNHPPTAALLASQILTPAPMAA